MQKLSFFIILCLVANLASASKLTHFFRKMEERDRVQRAMEWQQDMNFNDFSFRLDRRYFDDHGQRCRDYIFRARSNPFRHGYFTVCDER